ncbi:MAG: hypothetical protein ACRENS_11080 [Candidatus Eiseniibacteriota bacterium]
MPKPRPLHAPAHHRANLSILALALMVLTVAGCARDQSANSASPERAAVASRLIGPQPAPDAFQWPEIGRHAGHLPYPLAVGNRWSYLIHTTTTLITDAGPQPPVSYDSPWLVTTSGTQVQDGHLYFEQSEFDPRTTPPGPIRSFLVRQDRTGLFDRELVTISPTGQTGPPGAGAKVSPFAARLLESFERMPAAAAHPAEYRRAALALAARVESALHPGAPDRTGASRYSPEPGEITMLRYPLYTGASWIVRDSPRFVRRVAGRERLHVPAGEFPSWRIAGDSELFGPNDRVTYWYGAPGLLRIQVHAELNATDDTGAIIGTALFDSDQVLTDANLRGPIPGPSFSASEADEP